ncbi:MAG: TOMM precursor leader peptide-binding protein, partial [Cyanobacteria bacterium P01_F01_bin.42]
MLSVPAFSPYWQLFKLGRGGFLASEQAYHWLDDDLILAVLSQIDGERSSQHIAQKLAPEIAVERTYYALMQLAAGGILIEKGDESQIEASDCQGFREMISAATDDLPNSTSVIVKGETDLLNKEIEGVLAKCTDCAKGQSGKVILYSTRELLSPQLKAAAVEAWNSNHSFLPVKFYGREPIVGPLIAPSKSGCIECLWDRLSSNMRLKLMLPANYEAPFLHDRALAAWEIVSERLRGPYNGRRSPHTLLQWSEREKSWLSHTLIARPHCTLCGNEASWKNDLGLGRFAKRKLTYDTTTLGHRIVPASRTLRHFSLHDSALTGTFFYDNTDSGIPDYFGCYALLNVATPPDIEHGHNLKAFKSMSAGGKGTNRENALASAFGEAIERFCLINDDGRPLHQARPSELHAFSHVAPSKLINFSNRQYDNREQLNELEDHVNIPERMPEDPVLKWWPCWSLTDDKAKLLPAAYVQRSPSLREQDWFSCNSNGMAAGNCCEEALIQGACELIERDAFGLWWYHMRHSPVLD